MRTPQQLPQVIFFFKGSHLCTCFLVCGNECVSLCVAISPEARPIDPLCRNVGSHHMSQCRGLCNHITRSEAVQQGHNRSNKNSQKR